VEGLVEEKDSFKHVSVRAIFRK
jgi:hypothetical protein